MTWKKSIGGVACLMLLLFGACRPSLSLTDPAPLVPSQLGQVMALNMGRLGQKLPMKEVEQLSFVSFLKANADNDPNGQKALNILKNWHNLGIDFSKRAYLCGNEDVFYLYFLLNNPKRFTKNFKNKVKKEKDIRFVALSQTAEIAWKGNVAILSFKGLKSLGRNAADAEPFELDAVPNPPLSRAQLFALKRENSIAEMADFQKLLDEGHDITNFSPMGRSILYKLLDKKPLSTLFDRLNDTQIAALSEANVLGYTDFNAGEMRSESLFFIDSTLANPLRTMFRPQMPTAFSRLTQHPKLVATANLALNAPQFMKMIKERVLSETERSAVSVADTLMNAIDGSVLAGVYMGDSMNINVVIAAQLIDPEQVKAGLIQNMGDRLVKIDDNLFVLKDKKSIDISTYDDYPIEEDSATYNGDILMMEPDEETVVPALDTAVTVDSSDIDLSDYPVEEEGDVVVEEENEVVETDIAEVELMPDVDIAEPSPRPNPLKSKPNYWLFKDNMLYLTDSITADKIRSGAFFEGETATAPRLTDGTMNVYFNMSQLMAQIGKSIPTGLVGNLFQEFPIQEFHSNITANKSFTSLKMTNKGENSLLSMVKAMDKILGFYFTMVKK